MDMSLRLLVLFGEILAISRCRETRTKSKYNDVLTLLSGFARWQVSIIYVTIQLRMVNNN